MRRLAWLILPILLAAPAAAETIKMPALTFDTPGGVTWERGGNANVVTFTYKTEQNGRTGAAMIQITTTPGFTGDFDAQVDAQSNIIDVLKGEEPIVDTRGVTTNGWPVRHVIKCCGTGDVAVDYTIVAFRTPDSFMAAELVVIQLGDEDEDLVDAAFEQMVASFDFAGYGARPAVPPTEAGDDSLEGLFFHSESTLMPNGLGGLDFVVNMTTYFFQPNGLLAEEPPAGAATLEEFCAGKAEACGSYKISNGQITLNLVGSRFGIVGSETAPFAHQEGGFEIDGDVFTPIPPLDDLKLDGTWSYFYAASGSAGQTTTSVATLRTLVFRPDGSFNRSGFVGYSSTTDIAGDTAGVTGSSDRPEESGTYTIDGYTLALTLADGTTEFMSIYMPDRNDIDLLVIDGSSYLRDGRD